MLIFHFRLLEAPQFLVAMNLYIATRIGKLARIYHQADKTPIITDRARKFLADAEKHAQYFQAGSTCGNQVKIHFTSDNPITFITNPVAHSCDCGAWCEIICGHGVRAGEYLHLPEIDPERI